LAKGERSAVELTRELRDELAEDARRTFCVGSIMCTLWRRDAVFQFEIQWSEWFLKEATIEETGEWVDDRNGYGHHNKYYYYDAFLRER